MKQIVHGLLQAEDAGEKKIEEIAPCSQGPVSVPMVPQPQQPEPPPKPQENDPPSSEKK